MSYKRIKPVTAFFHPNGANIFVIDEKGIVWKSEHNGAMWTKYSVLPDISDDAEEDVDTTATVAESVTGAKGADKE